MLNFLLVFTALHLFSGSLSCPLNGFSTNPPVTGEVSKLYKEIFSDVACASPCTLTGRITRLENGSYRTTPMGCLPQNGGFAIATLVPIDWETYRYIDGWCTNGTDETLANALNVVTAASTSTLQESIGLAYILGGSLSNSNGTLYSFDCIHRFVSMWNKGNGSSPVRLVVARSETFEMRAGNPSFNATISAVTTLLIDTFSLLLFPTSLWSEAVQQFESVVRLAMLNSVDSQSSATLLSPLPALDLVAPMYMTFGSGSTTCLDDSTCLPLGGENVIGTTARSEWKFIGADFIKETPARSVAIVVSSTSPGFLHDVIPAADSVVSGIVATLLVLDCLTRSLTFEQHLPQLYTFFLPAEEYGHVGSSRLITETSNFHCTRFSENGGCDFPRYAMLNFTTIDLTKIDHFVEVQQVGFGDNLFFHTLSTQSPQQQFAADAFSSAGMIGSTSSPPSLSPLFEFSSLGVNHSYSLISRFDDRYVNPNLFTPNDTHISFNQVMGASKNLAKAIASLLSLSGTLLPINESLGEILLDCFSSDLNCAAFSNNNDQEIRTPNYYSSVFTYSPNSRDNLISRVLRSFGLQSFFSHAFSTKLDYVDSDEVLFRYSNTTSSGEVWVESNWGLMGLRAGVSARGGSISVVFVATVVINAAAALLLKWICWW